MLLVGLFADVDYALQSVGAGVGFTFIGVTILGPALARPAARVLGAPLRALRGTTGQIARENAMRNPTRTASTASALMIGVALITLLSVFLASLETEIDTTVGEVFLGDVGDRHRRGFGLTGVGPEPRPPRSPRCSRSVRRRASASASPRWPGEPGWSSPSTPPRWARSSTSA